MLERLLQQTQDLLHSAEGALMQGEPGTIVDRAPLLVRSLRALVMADPQAWPSASERRDTLGLIAARVSALQAAAVRAQAAATREKALLLQDAAGALTYDESGRLRTVSPFPTKPST